jgi:hypothetical protein
LKPLNPDDPPITITANDADRLAVVAELVEVRPPVSPSS